MSSEKNTGRVVSMDEAERQARLAERRKRFVGNANTPLYGVIDPLTWIDKSVPEREWVVRGFIPNRNVTLLSGHGGIGKSYLTLELLIAAATGHDWLGLPTKHVKAMGVFAEDEADELHRRVVAITQAMGLGVEDLENLVLVDRTAQDNVLVEFDRFTSAGEVTYLYTQIMNAALESGLQLIVLDSLHNMFSGNENDRPQAYTFIRCLRELAMEIDGAVVLLAHPSRAGISTGSGDSGSTAWHNSVRSRVYVSEVEDEPGVLTLSNKKQNYARKADQVRLNWNAEGTAIVRREEHTGTVAGIERRSAETVFLELAKGLDRSGVTLCHKKHAGNYAPKILMNQDNRGPFTQKDFESAMWRLINDGTLEIVNEGPPSRRVQKLHINTEGRLL